MKRGEIWWVDFDPAQGGEIRKRRPAVIVSNDKANAAQNRVQVLPATSAAATVDPWEAPASMGVECVSANLITPMVPHAVEFFHGSADGLHLPSTGRSPRSGGWSEAPGEL